MSKSKHFKFYLTSLKKYSRKNVSSIVGGSVILLIFMFLSLLTPVLTKVIIDDVILAKNVHLLNLLIVIMVIILIVGSAFNYLYNYVLIKFDQTVKLNLKKDILSHLLRLPLSFFSKRKTGEITYRVLSDSEVLSNSLAILLINILVNLVMLFAIGAAMLYLNLFLSAIVFSVFAIHVFIIYKFQSPIMKYAFLTKEANERLLSESVEKISGLGLIKSTGSEQGEDRKFLRRLKDIFEVNIKSFLILKGSEISVSSANNLWAFGVLWFGSIQVMKGNLTLGGLVAFTSFSSMLYRPVSSLTNIILSFQEIKASLIRLLEIMDLPCEFEIVKQQERHGPSLTGRIRFDNVSFSYDQREPVLKDVNLEIEPGTTVALVGRSGVGKTTLCGMISRFFDPSRGSVYLDDFDVKDLDLSWLRSKIGIVLQGVFTFSGTVEENITYGIQNVNEEMMVHAAKLANIHDFISSLPDGYHTQVGEKGVNLSGGEAQRIALARVFLKEPKIVIFDEPTCFLDAQNEHSIQEAIKNLKGARTTIIIGHRLSTVMNADKIFVLENGTITEQGTHEELIMLNKSYKKLYEHVLSH